MREVFKKEVFLHITDEERILLKANMREYTDVVIQLVDYALGQGKWPKLYGDNRIKANLTHNMAAGAIEYARVMYEQSRRTGQIPYDATDMARPYAVITNGGFTLRGGTIGFPLFGEDRKAYFVETEISPEDEMFFQDKSPYMMRLIRKGSSAYYAQVWYHKGIDSNQTGKDIRQMPTDTVEVCITAGQLPLVRSYIQKYTELTAQLQEYVLGQGCWTSDLRSMKIQAELPMEFKVAALQDARKEYMDYLANQEMRMLEEPCAAWSRGSAQCLRLIQADGTLYMPILRKNGTTISIKLQLSTQDAAIFEDKTIWKVRIREDQPDHFQADITWNNKSSK